MKIGVVTPRYPPVTSGGGAQSCKLLVENLRKKGHDVEVICFDGEREEDPDYVNRESLKWSRNDLMNILAMRKVKKFSKDKDVIHAYNIDLNPAVGLLKDVKKVATLNGYQYLYPYQVPGAEVQPGLPFYRKNYNKIARRMMNGIDRFVALSSAVKEQYSRVIPEEKIDVIPNMYDPDFPERVSIETNEKEILYVGRLDESKGVTELVEQMTELPEYKLTIVGDGPTKKQIEEKVEELDLGNTVKLEGYVEHSKIPEYYARAGWFVHPAKWPEPFGRTILEAMQLGTPVLATNKGGPKDTLHNSQLFEHYNDISTKIRELDREEIIESQNEKLRNHNPANVSRMYENVYEEVLAL